MYSYTDVNYVFMRVVFIVYNFCPVYKLKGRRVLYNFYDFVDAVCNCQCDWNLIDKGELNYGNG